MPTETFDVHGVEPVPARDRTSSSGDQFWIWMGANIAPINWVLGTLGITLGLSLVETLVVIAVTLSPPVAVPELSEMSVEVTAITVIAAMISAVTGTVQRSKVRIA